MAHVSESQAHPERVCLLRSVSSGASQTCRLEATPEPWAVHSTAAGRGEMALFCPRTAALCLQTRVPKTKEENPFYQTLSVGKGPSSPVNHSSSTSSAGWPAAVSDMLRVYTVVDVAYNPGVLQAAEKHHVKKDQLIRMTMKCIEEFQCILSHSYSIPKFRIKGSIQSVKQNQNPNWPYRFRREKGKGADPWTHKKQFCEPMRSLSSALTARRPSFKQNKLSDRRDFQYRDPGGGEETTSLWIKSCGLSEWETSANWNRSWITQW